MLHIGRDRGLSFDDAPSCARQATDVGEPGTVM